MVDRRETIPRHDLEHTAIHNFREIGVAGAEEVEPRAFMADGNPRDSQGGGISLHAIERPLDRRGDLVGHKRLFDRNQNHRRTLRVALHGQTGNSTVLGEKHGATDRRIASQGDPIAGRFQPFGGDGKVAGVFDGPHDLVDHCRLGHPLRESDSLPRRVVELVIAVEFKQPIDVHGIAN